MKRTPKDTQVETKKLAGPTENKAVAPEQEQSEPQEQDAPQDTTTPAPKGAPKRGGFGFTAPRTPKEG